MTVATQAEFRSHCCSEIARLQNSLKHLRQTQEELKEFVASEEDAEITQVIVENEVVMSVDSVSGDNNPNAFQSFTGGAHKHSQDGTDRQRHQLGQSL